MTVRVRVDFNSRGPSGTVRGSAVRADGELAEQQVVELYDPAEPEMVFSATVTELHEGKALFVVDWEPSGAAVTVGHATTYLVQGAEQLPVDQSNGALAGKLYDRTWLRPLAAGWLQQAPLSPA